MRILSTLCVLTITGSLFCSVALASVENDQELKFVDANGEALADVVVFEQSEQVANSKAENKAAGSSKLHLMDQVNMQFAPQLLVIQSGDRVAFPNSDDIRHHVYSFSEPRQFEMRLFSAGESPEIDFPRSGVVVVGCNIHDQMMGHILVLNTRNYLLSDENGIVSAPVSSASWEIWHPWMAEKGQAPLRLEEVLANASEGVISLDIEAPEGAPESELESRFKRAFDRNNN